jgi:hypothetical protein
MAIMVAPPVRDAVSTGPDREALVRQRGAASWLSGGLAIVSAVAAAATFLVPGVLRGTAVMNGSARGTALVVLCVAVPLLVASMLVAGRGSARALVVWLGAIAYLLYNAVLFLFATPFNSLFLLYAAMFALAVWSAAVVLHTLDVDAFAARFAPTLPARAIATFLGAVAGLNALAWLVQVVPALITGGDPAFLAGTGLTTNPIYAQDLAFWVPLMAVAAVLLWRRRPWGLVLTGALLTMGVIEAVGVAVDQAFGHAADPASSVASATLVPAFLVLALIELAVLVVYQRHLDRG